MLPKACQMVALWICSSEVNVVNDLMLDMIGTILTTILLSGNILGVTLISMPIHLGGLIASKVANAAKGLPDGGIMDMFFRGVQKSPLVNVVNDLILDMIGTILTTILLSGNILGVTLISMRQC
jgi:hypothetical protein